MTLSGDTKVVGSIPCGVDSTDYSDEMKCICAFVFFNENNIITKTRKLGAFSMSTN